MNPLLTIYVSIIVAVLLVLLALKIFKDLRWPYVVERKSGEKFTVKAATHDEAVRIAETQAPGDVASVSFGKQGKINLLNQSAR